MSVEAEIALAVGGLVNGAIYPDVAPQGAPLPRIVYQGVGGRPLTFVESVAPDLENYRMQVVVWARTRAEASALRRRVFEALIESPVLRAEVLTGPINRHEQDTGLYGAMQDFSIWH